MTYDYQGSLTQKLVDELLEVIHKYDHTMMAATAIGCLEIAKAMQGMMADGQILQLVEDKELAKAAYGLADAMLKARQA